MDRLDAALASWYVLVPVSVLLVWACYSRILEGDFAFDDNFAILDNRDVNGDYDPALWYHDFWGQELLKNDSHKSYRPLAIMSFRMTRRFWSVTDIRAPFASWPFHLENIVLHMLVGNLLRLATARVLALGRPGRWTRHVPTTAAVLHLALPANAEAVSGIVGRADLLAAVSVLMAFLVYSSSLSVLPKASGVCCWFAVAVLCKEVAVMILPVLVMYDLCRGWRDGKNGLLQALGLPMSLFAWLGGAYYTLRRDLMGEATGVGHLVLRSQENPMGFAPQLQTRLLSKAHVHTVYMGLLLNPWPALSADYSFDCLPLVKTLADVRNLKTLALYTAIPSGVALGLAWQRAAGLRPGPAAVGLPICFAAGWVVLFFLPAANIFFHVGTCVAERLLYIPSMGYCIILAIILGAITSSGARRGPAREAARSRRKAWCRAVAVAYLHVALLAVFICRLRRRCLDWRTEEHLMEAAHLVCPRSVKVLENMGTLQRRRQDWDAAMWFYETARFIDPSFCSPHYWEGLTEVNRGHVYEAIRKLKLALKCPFTLVKAAGLLQEIFNSLREVQPNNGTVLVEWGRICAMVEQDLEAYISIRDGAVKVYTEAPKKALAIFLEAERIATKANAEALRAGRDALIPAEARCSTLAWAGKILLETGADGDVEEHRRGMRVLREAASIKDYGSVGGLMGSTLPIADCSRSALSMLSTFVKTELEDTAARGAKQHGKPALLKSELFLQWEYIMRELGQLDAADRAASQAQQWAQAERGGYADQLLKDISAAQRAEAAQGRAQPSKGKKREKVRLLLPGWAHACLEVPEKSSKKKEAGKSKAAKVVEEGTRLARPPADWPREKPPPLNWQAARPSPRPAPAQPPSRRPEVARPAPPPRPTAEPPQPVQAEPRPRPAPRAPPPSSTANKPSGEVRGAQIVHAAVPPGQKRPWLKPGPPPEERQFGVHVTR